MLLFAAPFMPREVKSAPEASKAPNHLVASALPRSGMGSYVRVIKSPSVEPAHVEDANWLQEAIDLADKLGILSCKPVITADRRQRAFALYTLYMGLQDLRSEVDRNAVRLNSALERISGTDQPRPADLKDVVALGRSYERGMTAILRWDAETMKHVVRDYVSELQTMDNVRSMLTFLAGIKREPKLVANLRTIPGLEVLEE
jgi:hypothetical protein